ncbi:MAG: alpha/beta fold hydrolase BchO [Pseudorhodobacter sp.]
MADLPSDLPPDLPANWPMRDASHLVTTAGHRWHVQQMGAGPDLLLLHGAGGATHSWRAIAPLLAPHFRLTIPDLAGQGFSRMGARGRAGLDAMAGDLTSLCAHLDIRPQGILGHSAGAAIALRMTTTLPQPPQALVGINAALGSFDGIAGVLFPVMAKALTYAPFLPQIIARAWGTESKVASLLASTGSPLDVEGRTLYQTLVSRPSHVEGTLAMMAQWRLDALLASLPGIATPTLLVAAADDRAVPSMVSARAAARLPVADYAELPQGGHLLHETRPEAVGGLILPFLNRHVR